MTSVHNCLCRRYAGSPQVLIRSLSVCYVLGNFWRNLSFLSVYRFFIFAVWLWSKISCQVFCILRSLLFQIQPMLLVIPTIATGFFLFLANDNKWFSDWVSVSASLVFCYLFMYRLLNWLWLPCWCVHFVDAGINYVSCNYASLLDPNAKIYCAIRFICLELHWLGAS